MTEYPCRAIFTSEDRELLKKIKDSFEVRSFLATFVPEGPWGCRKEISTVSAIVQGSDSVLSVDYLAEGGLLHPAFEELCRLHPELHIHSESVNFMSRQFTTFDSKEGVGMGDIPFKSNDLSATISKLDASSFIAEELSYFFVHGELEED
jgi:hypothetical protein